MRESIDNLCRICLDFETEQVSIFKDSLILHMQSCLSMDATPGDGLPEVICTHCVSQLQQFYNFQMSAKCSKDWLESTISELANKPEPKIQPLPNSEYNSDSLLEFLNNTTNIDVYLSNLGKDDIPAIVNMLTTENPSEPLKLPTKPKSPSPKKKEPIIKITKDAIKVDVLESDYEIVKEILIREAGQVGLNKAPKTNIPKDNYNCFACKTKFDDPSSLSQHLIVCETAIHTCWYCNILLESKYKLFDHILTHIKTYPVTCNCGKKFMSKSRLLQHFETCQQKHIQGLKFTYRCKKCGVVYDDRLKLYRHVKTHIIKAEEKTCDICLHKFADKQELKNHKKVDHNIKDDLVIHRCKICKFTSRNRMEVYKHVQRHLQAEQPTCHLCDACGQSFTTRFSLARHAKKHKHEADSYQPSSSSKEAQSSDSRTTDLGLKGKEKGIEMTICEQCGVTVDSNELNIHKCVYSIVLT